MKGIRTRLSVMMFLQFFIWGAWYTMIGVYMAKVGMERLTFWPFTVNPLAAIVAPFFVGLVADRFFATERVFGLLHLIGGVVLLAVPSAYRNPGLFIGLLLLYNLCYMPTLGLSSSLGFHHIADQEKDFPKIRVWGTIGWIIAGWFIDLVLVHFANGLKAEETALPIYAAAIASFVLAAFSLSLPHTPAPARGQQVSVRSIIGLDAFKQLGSPSFYVFIISAFLICIPLAAYYNFTQLYLVGAKVQNITLTQSMGQMSEMLFMLAMPLMFARWGVKKMLIAGMAAWVLRYALFAAAAPSAIYWMIALGILLHGICYDFFFVTGMIYVDKKSTPAIRGQAQGFFVFVTYGVGMLIGAYVAGNMVYNRFLGSAQALTLEQWRNFWVLPSAFALVILIFFALAFHDREAEVKPSESGVAAGGKPRMEAGSPART
jgi:nucleoside transporter